MTTAVRVFPPTDVSPMRCAPARYSFILMGLVCAHAAAAVPPACAEGTKIAGKFGDWTLYVNENAAGKICFIASEPKKKQPGVSNRATAVFYVTAWPKDGVKAEPSLKLGYPIKTDSKVAVTIGANDFRLFPKEERAYVADALQEQKLLEALKKGPSATVKAVPQKGEITTDSYSLSGFGDALQAMAKNCQ